MKWKFFINKLFLSVHVVYIEQEEKFTKKIKQRSPLRGRRLRVLDSQLCYTPGGGTERRMEGAGAYNFP